ncbi:hypothetical protein [Streptomyces sp. Isolate_45]|uniref:hypothetical protein n=1 Tax=Streptomyces sp. Isolate_45 TaxID=2950111 RepID=UPI002481E96B|nr:hypothetical protein [Streptomyces sp. Isolate_45]MDA5280972.1 hypothetical protein [Streptomyces sp. Isolate_45]
MKIKFVSALALAVVAVGVAPAAPAFAVDPRQEYNTANCYFDKSKSGKEKEKYCKALIGKDLTAGEKECLKRAGIAGAAALTIGRINNKKAKEIVVNSTGAALAACFSSKVK